MPRKAIFDFHPKPYDAVSTFSQFLNAVTQSVRCGPGAQQYITFQPEVAFGLHGVEMLIFTTKEKQKGNGPAGIYHAAGNRIQTGHGKVKAKVKAGPRTAVLDSRSKTGFLLPSFSFAAECGTTEENGVLLAWKNPRRVPVGPCLEPVSPPPRPLARRFA
ncbi:predicted protein [Histoplasma capsulatum G186AR]|uniref:Uncharacterized protein n=1 Tax=Ajellomyces capsulatus (strain G186AR / H82 / ATCC MYA-2454 / RMSCC 2432) TaxID=447093 RepID=C0NDY2_AJECG|nr:uncharacterized protein HCBG_02075 [Histoplasma capsulatum G186AR]EEH10430.1 predicted protein [Histoplasma capsulatum G186AR]